MMREYFDIILIFVQNLQIQHTKLNLQIIMVERPALIHEICAHFEVHFICALLGLLRNSEAILMIQWIKDF